MPGTLASLRIKLGLDATGVEQGVARAERSIGGLDVGAGTAMKVARTLIGGGLGLAAKGALEMEDPVAALQAAAGASAEEARHFADSVNAAAGSSLVAWTTSPHPPRESGPASASPARRRTRASIPSSATSGRERLASLGPVFGFDLDTITGKTDRTRSSWGWTWCCHANSRSVGNVSLVGARGVEPPGPITRIIVPPHIAEALRDVA